MSELTISPLGVTPFNYFSEEVGKAYFSNSQIGNWLKCPARALAMLNGEWKFQVTEEMTAGSYADVALTNPAGLDKFVAAHPEMIASRGPTTGQLKSKFKNVLACVEKVKATPRAIETLQGPGVDQQVILTGVIHGKPFRGMLDAIDVDKGIITDLKCMGNFDDKWDGHAKVPWYQFWGYWRQGAIYRELASQTYGKEFQFNLLAVTKQTPPDMQYIKLQGDGAYRIEMARIKTMLDEIEMVAKGEMEAAQCLSCDYCRYSKGFDVRVGEYA